MRRARYPHEVIFLELKKVPDGGGGYSSLWTATVQIDAFMDTPSSRQIFEAHQLNNPLDRNLFFPYRTDIHEKMRCTFEGDTYELVGRPQNQGGRDKVMLVPLKLVKA